MDFQLGDKAGGCRRDPLRPDCDYVEPIAGNVGEVQLFERLVHAPLERLARFVQGHTGHDTGDEVLESADVQPALDGHLYQVDLLLEYGEAVTLDQGPVLFGRQMLSGLNFGRFVGREAEILAQDARTLEHPFAVELDRLGVLTALVE